MPDAPFTFNDLRAARDGSTPVPMLTCYDFTTARVLRQAGVPMLLVGDSASSVILGHESTLPVSLDFMIELTAAVKRGAPGALVMGDMPFGSYQASVAQGVSNVCRMIQRSGCDCVKIEASASDAPLIRRLTDAGVAVVAHLGLRPQAVGLMGGYKYQGRTAREAREIADLSRQLEAAGAAALLLEAVPPEVSEAVVAGSQVPVIGCGAGPACHAHVVVLQDLLGQTPRQPKFVPKLGGAGLLDVARNYVTAVQQREYPVASQCYEMPAGERERFAARGAD